MPAGAVSGPPLRMTPAMAPALHRPAVDGTAQRAGLAAERGVVFTAADMDAAVRTIAGSARSMGITVEGVK